MTIPAAYFDSNIVISLKGFLGQKPGLLLQQQPQKAYPGVSRCTIEVSSILTVDLRLINSWPEDIWRNEI